MLVKPNAITDPMKLANNKIMSNPLEFLLFAAVQLSRKVKTKNVTYVTALDRSRGKLARRTRNCERNRFCRRK